MKIGAGWIKSAKNNEKYISCQIELDGKKYNFSIFKNKYKNADNHPDYTILGLGQNNQSVSRQNYDNVNKVFADPL